MIKTIFECYNYWGRFGIPFVNNTTNTLIVVIKTQFDYSRLQIDPDRVFIGSLNWTSEESCTGYGSFSNEDFFQSPLETNLGKALYDQN